ncbi:MAG: Lrp/AsnC family transcriptional regulator [Candidatus Babeliales bacterium]
MSIENTPIDEIDKKILETMQEDASLTNSEVAQKINLSPSATHERIRKLHTQGIIKKIAAFVQATAIEKSLCAFIYVLIDTPQHNKFFLKEIIKNPSIMECHHITGEYSYVLKVRVKNTHELESFITDSLKSKLGIVRSLTHIVLSSPKDGGTIID